jgi:hypothetical protein
VPVSLETAGVAAGDDPPPPLGDPHEGRLRFREREAFAAALARRLGRQGYGVQHFDADEVRRYLSRQSRQAGTGSSETPLNTHRATPTFALQ